MSKPTVLVVDDEVGIRALIQVVLEDDGCNPLLAGTPSNALRLAGVRRPDLAILDYMLPEMDGIELGRRLRERFGDTFPLVFISALEVPKSKLAELSSYLYVSKPFDVGSLIEAVHSALAPAQPRPLNAGAPEEPRAYPSTRRSASR